MTHPSPTQPQTRLHLLSLGASVASALIAAILLWSAPTERSLGSGIRFVYVHVSLIWVGLLGLSFSGILGLLLTSFPSRRLSSWLTPLARVSLASFAAGFIVSMPAASVNWGAIFWAEPRYFSISLAIVTGLLVHAAHGWLPWPRAKGALHAAYALFVFWMIQRTPLVLHPRNPVQGEGSGAIPMYFAAFSLLFLLLALWWVFYLHRLSHSLSNGEGINAPPSPITSPEVGEEV